MLEVLHSWTASSWDETMMYMQIPWHELGSDNKKRGEEKGQGPQIIHFTGLATSACTPPRTQLWLGQEEFFLWRRASTLCLMLCLLELLSSYYLDLYLTGNQKDATDSFHTNHRKKSQLTGSLSQREPSPLILSWDHFMQPTCCSLS